MTNFAAFVTVSVCVMHLVQADVDPDCGYVNAGGIPFGLDTCFSEYNSTTGESDSFMISCGDGNNTIVYSGWSSLNCPGDSDYDVELAPSDIGLSDLNCGTNNDCVTTLREYESSYKNSTGDCNTTSDSWNEYGVATGYCIDGGSFSLVLECDNDGNAVTNIYGSDDCSGSVVHTESYGECECGESSDEDDPPLCEMDVVISSPCGATTTTQPTTTLADR